MTVTPVAPAAAMAPMAASRCSTPSVSPGRTGARKTPHGNPAPVTARTRSSRARGVGTPGSRAACSSSSQIASDTPNPTGTRSAAATSSGMSRRASVPLVRMENGVSDSASAVITPGINR